MTVRFPFSVSEEIFYTHLPRPKADVVSKVRHAAGPNLSFVYEYALTLLALAFSNISPFFKAPFPSTGPPSSVRSLSHPLQEAKWLLF
jgi:hypothetical protein